MWNYQGQRRPDFAIKPGPGQESVWDYPRPPVMDPSGKRVEVRDADQLIASSECCMRVLETASPPTFYLPPDDIKMTLLQPASGTSWCEWKGAAQYWRLANAPMDAVIGWSYPHPNPSFEAIRDWICFYPGKIACYVDGERVRPQAGNFYGGWITDAVAGPFKGDPGTGGW